MSKPKILEIEEKVEKNIYEETVLFEGNENEPELSDSIENYDYLYITCSSYKTQETFRIDNPKVGMQVSHLMGSYDGWIYLRICMYILEEKQIKLNAPSNVTLQGESGTSLSFATASVFSILKVVGGKKVKTI